MNPALVAQLVKIFSTGAVICGLIYGLRNIPFFADFFVKWPKLGVVVNAALSLFVSLGGCLAAGVTAFADLTMCVLTAGGVFLSAAGIHMAVSSISTGNSSSGSATIVKQPDGTITQKPEAAPPPPAPALKG